MSLSARFIQRVFERSVLVFHSSFRRPEQPEDNGKINIVQTNDIHSAVLEFPSSFRRCYACSGYIVPLFARSCEVFLSCFDKCSNVSNIFHSTYKIRLFIPKYESYFPLNTMYTDHPCMYIKGKVFV